jgi:hypothetical protein
MGSESGEGCLSRLEPEKASLCQRKLQPDTKNPAKTEAHGGRNGFGFRPGFFSGFMDFREFLLGGVKMLAATGRP